MTIGGEMDTYVFVNQKGGVGKAMVLGVAAALAARETRAVDGRWVRPQASVREGDRARRCPWSTVRRAWAF
jgi:hypothetical protein